MTQGISIGIRVIGALLSAGQTVLLARLLGVAELGQYSGILAITTLLSIPASAGLPAFLTREIAKARAASNYALARGLLASTTALATLSALASMLILVMLFAVGLLGSHSWTVVAASCLLIPLLCIDTLRAGAMRGLGSALMSQVPENILRPGSFLVFVVAWALTGRDVGVLEAVLSFGAAGLVSALFGQTLLFRRLRGVGPGRDRISLAYVRRSSTGLTLLGGSNSLIANLDVAILTVGGFFVAAGNYRIALLGVVALLLVYNALADVARRDFASGLARNSPQEIIDASDIVTKYGTLAVGCTTVVYAIAGYTGIEWIFGPEYASAFGALLIVSIGHLLAVACGPAVELALALSSQRKAVRVNLLGVVVTMTASIGLLSWDPLLGVAIGSAAGNVVRRWLMSRHVRNVLQFDPSLVGMLRRL